MDQRGDRPRLLTRRLFTTSAATAAMLPLAAPFIVKARGETPIKVGVLETITGTNGAFGRNEVAGFELAPHVTCVVALRTVSFSAGELLPWFFASTASPAPID